MSLQAILTAATLDLPALAAHLDGLDHLARVRDVRSIGGRDQARLYAAARGFRAVDLHFFVPAAKPSRALVRHHGKNSLPAFTEFEKRFARPNDGATELWGYNHNDAFTTFFSGPGHYVAVPGDAPGEVNIDYRRIPAERLDGVPPLRPNTRFPDVLVYGHMVDVMRGLSAHVSIGRAIRRGKESANYFLLCRED